MGRARRLLLGIALAVGFVCSLLSLPARAAPEPVGLGIYLNSLSNLNMGAGTFAADFWLWATTRSAQLDPLDSIDIINEVQKEREPGGRIRVGDVHWDQRRLRVTARSDWNLAHFPFEQQRLQIIFEDSHADADELAYTADRANSGIHPSLHVPGWRILSWDFKASTYEYPTSFGHPEKPAPTRFSRLVFSIDMQREGITDFFELTLGAFVAFTILALTFRMNPTLPPIFAGRMGVIVASVFTVTISLRGINTTFNLPIGSTLVDRIHLLTLGAGFVAAVAAALARHYAETNREAQALALDRRLMPVLIVVFVLGTLLLTIPALRG